MSIIIAGGGMAGATLALALSALSGGRCAVTLVEALAPAPMRIPALTPAPLRWPTVPVNSWRRLASGRRWPPARPPFVRCR